MDTEKGVQPATTDRDSRRASRWTWRIVVFRFLTFASALSAFVVMITDKQSANVFAIPNGPAVKVWAKYHYSKAFVWFVVANGVAFGYALLTMFLTPLVRSQKTARILLLLDLGVAFIIMSGASAASAIAHVGNKGLRQAGWGRICGTYNRYCDHVSGALIASYHAWMFLTIVIIFSLHRRH